MLTNAQAFQSFSVDDLDKAKKFYSETLGLKVEVEDMGILNIALAEDKFVMIYPKPNHQPATYTTLNFLVDDIDEAVKELNEKGVTFDIYEDTGMEQDQFGIFRGDAHAMAWFRDPADNIISIIQEMS